MRLLLDENIDSELAVRLAAADHDITAIARDYAPGLLDRQILAIGHREQRVIITRDRDFGELIVRERLPPAGALYLRLRGQRNLQHERVIAVLAEYTDQLRMLVTVTEQSVRVRAQ